MSKRIFKRLLAGFLACLMLASLLCVSAFADGSHGFYMECSIVPVNNKADGFMIDFYSDAENALATYYSNANWGMYIIPTKNHYNYKTMVGGGAYAGLQITYRSNMRKGIMSFWRYECTDWMDNVSYIYADVMMGKSTHYDNEGSGTSCVMDYQWDCGTWYRELLYCWEDVETGETFMGNWYYNYNTDHWDLFVYYNTHLIDSYINSGVSQFLENFSQSYRENVRNFRYKGVYVLGHETGEWISSPTVKVFTDRNEKAVGETSMGVAEDGSYVWGQVDGGSAIDSDDYKEMTTTIVQPEKPQNIGTPKFSKVSVKTDNDGNQILSWEMDEHSTPQLSYRLTVTDPDYKVIYSGTQTRPNVQEVNLGKLNSDVFTCTLTVKDVFGQSVKQSYTVGLKGDLNNDGILSIADVTTLLNGLQNQNSSAAYDLTGDGIVSIQDVTACLLLLKNR